jgi:hypothetical protein
LTIKPNIEEIRASERKHEIMEQQEQINNELSTEELESATGGDNSTAIGALGAGAMVSGAMVYHTKQIGQNFTKAQDMLNTLKQTATHIK